MRVAVVLAAAAVAVGACGSDAAERAPAVDAPQLAPVVKDDAAGKPVPVGRRVQARIRLPEGICSGIAAGGSLWLTGVERGTLLRVDPAKNEIVDRLQLPEIGCEMVADEKRVYVEARRQVFVVDMASGRIERRLRAENGFGVPAVGYGSLWYSTDRENQEVTRFAIPSGLVQKRIGGVGTLEAGPTDLVAAGGAIWVGNFDGTLQKIDPKTNKVVQTVEAGTQPSVMLPDGRWLWFANFENRTMGRLDLRRGKVAQRIEAGGGRIAVVGDDVWTIGSNGETPDEKPADPLLWRIDRGSGKITERILVGRPFPQKPEGEIDLRQSPPPLGALMAADGSLWVINGFERRLYRLDPS